MRGDSRLSSTENTFSVPVDGLLESGKEVRLGLISEIFSGQGYVCLGVLYISRPRVAIDRRNVLARDPIDFLEEGIESDPITAGNIERTSGRVGSRARKKVCLDDVLNERKVTGLQAVAMNCGPAILKDRGNKKGQHTAILRR